MDGTSLGGTLSDPLLALRSVSGRLLTQDDNSGTGSDAELYYSAPDGGWYYLDAGASGNTARGTYVLRGSSLMDDYANSVLTEGLVTLGTPRRVLAPLPHVVLDEGRQTVVRGPALARRLQSAGARDVDHGLRHPVQGRGDVVRVHALQSVEIKASRPFSFEPGRRDCASLTRVEERRRDLW